MTNELKDIIKKINLLLINYCSQENKIESANIILEIEPKNYKETDKKIYTIILIGENLTLKDRIKLEEMLQKVLPHLETDNIKINTSPILEAKKQLLLNIKMYTKEQFETLTYTLKHQIGLNHKLLYGKDYLKKYQTMLLTKNELEIDLNTYIESLKELINTNNDNLANILKLINVLFKEIYEFANRKYEIPEDKMLFFIRLLGKKIYITDTLFLLHSILTKNDLILIKMFDNPHLALINLLNNIKDSFQTIDSCFELKSSKIKRLVPTKR